MKLRHTKGKFRKTYLTPRQEREYDAMKRDGYMDRYLLTLTGPPGKHRTNQWFHETWAKNVRDWESFSGQLMKGRSLIVATRGFMGEDNSSAHVVFKGPRAPKDFDFLIRNWKNRYGTVEPGTVDACRRNKNGLRYWVKNRNERDAETDIA